MADVPLKYCVCCDSIGEFTDQPDGYVSGRWAGLRDFPVCKCDVCGATYPRESIDETVRKEV